MEAGDGAAGDGHEQEGKQLAFDDGAAAVNELRERRELNVGMNDEDADDQQNDGAQLHVGGKIVARFEQEPDRQHRGDEAVGHHQERDLVAVEGQHMSEGRRRRTSVPPMTAAISKITPSDAGSGDADLARRALEHVQAHADGDGNGHADGEDSPGAVRPER